MCQHITTNTQATTVAVIGLTFAVFALVGRRSFSARATIFASMAGALTYPLYLLHNVGKELFLHTDFALPRSLRVAMAMVFSLLLSYVVMKVGTGPGRGLLTRAWDGMAGLMAGGRLRAARSSGR